MVPLAFAGVLAFAIGWPWRLVSVGCCALVRSKPETPLGKRTGRRANSAARLGMYGAGAISLLSFARDTADIQARSARDIAGVRGAPRATGRKRACARYALKSSRMSRSSALAAICSLPPKTQMPRLSGSSARGRARSRSSSAVVASTSERRRSRQSSPRPERRWASSLRPSWRGFTGASRPATLATMKPSSSSSAGFQLASHSAAASKRRIVGSTAGSRKEYISSSASVVQRKPQP